MTDQEAYILIADAIRLLRDSYHWGKIEVEVSEGKVKRVNLTTNLRPKQESNARPDVV